MHEYLINAKEDMKRIKHSVYVSLKYTRTVDVIKNILKRMITTLNHIVMDLLEFSIQEDKIKEYPRSIPLRCELVKEIYRGEEFSEELRSLIDFLLLLRKIDKIEDYTKINEYRRHVALITEIDGERIEVNLDEIMEYHNKTKRLIELTQEIIFGKKDD